MKGDILRHPDPTFPLYIEWLGHVSLTVLPGSSSACIALPSMAPVLTEAQPYDGRIVATPMRVGPHGTPVRPVFDTILDEGRALTIVAGVPTWV